MENNEGTVLWKCGACSDCFCDIQIFATHKCVGTSSSVSYEDSCITSDQLSESYGDLDTTSEQVEAISAIAALEEDPNYSPNRSSSSYSNKNSKSNRKPKPTIIAVNGSEKKVKSSQKAKRSLVWAYFTALDHKKAMCVMCQKIIAYCGTPTNLVYHLNRFHPVESEVVRSKQTGPAKYQYIANKGKKSGYATPKPKNPNNVLSIMQNAVRSVNIVPAPKRCGGDKIVELIAADLLPAKIVDGHGFKLLFNYFDPTFQMPDSKKLLKDLIPNRYYLESKKVKSAISSSEMVHLSIELWTGYEQLGYLTITAHFISQDFNLKHYVLSSCSEPSTITTVLLSCISDWNLTNSVEYIIADGSDRITKVVKAAGKKQVVCLAHTLDTVIKDTFSASLELNRLMEKCRSLVLFLKNDEAAKQKLIDIQTHDSQSQAIVIRENLEFEDAKSPNCPLKVKKDDPNYWNTTFYMFQRIYTLRNVVSAVMNSLPVDFQDFTKSEWLAIEETISLLKPFEVVTLELCNENFPPLSKVIPIVHGLLSLITNCSSLTLNFVERVRKDLLSQLYRHLGQIEQNVTLAVTTILDPRFKNIAFQSETAVDSAVQEIIHRGRKYKKKDPNVSVPQPDIKPNNYINTDSLWASFDKRATPRKEPEADNVVMSEVKNYFEEPLIDRKKSPIAWWRDYGSSRFPILGEIAKCMLSIPATSIQPSRIFMKTEGSFFEKRMNIKPKYLDQMLFLNSNME